MEIIRSILLGAVQGVTEFLPISSSGHLVIFQEIFGMNAESNLMFDTLLHFASLISICIVFYKDIYNLIKEFFSMLKDISKGSLEINNPYRRLVLLIIVGTIPVVIIGFAFKDKVEELFMSIQVVGFCLLITGFMLSISNKIIYGNKEASNMKYKNALAVGLFQSFALLPGISRSGSTIVGGLLNGLSREFAVRFSFLLSIPAIFGAIILQIPDLIGIESSSDIILPYILGMIASTLVGIASIKFLIKLLKENKFYIFSHYCWGVGVMVILYSIFVK